MSLKNIHPLRYSIHTRLREFHLRRLLPDTLNGCLLDVGCGLGYLTETLGNGFMRVGMEYDFHALKANRVRGLANMVQGDIIQLPFKEQSFDIILCSEVLEHLPEGMDQKVLVEMAYLLKSGGRLLITVPALEGLRAKSPLRNLGHDDPTGGEYHYRIGYSWQEMEAMISGVPSLRVKEKCYAMFLLSELFMDILKWMYFKKNKLKEHSDMMSMKDSLLFRLYRYLFPALYFCFICEDLVSASVFKGHILIVAVERVDERCKT